MKNIIKTLKSATQAQIEAGVRWYAIARAIACELAQKHNVSETQAAGVLAALSPNNRWSRNILDAEALIGAHVSGQPLPKVCTFTGNKNKAIAILSAIGATYESVCNILKGQKTVAFFSSILNLDKVCVDGHAYCIWAGKRLALDKVPSMSAKVFAHIQSHYAKVAKRSLALCGVSLTATELQAVTWVTYRDAHGIV